MTDMVVLVFDSENAADQGRPRLAELNRNYPLDLIDAVEVVRHTDGKFKVKNIRNITGTGGLDGAFWGLVFGLLFFLPFYGIPVGAVSATMGSHFTHFGIGKDFITEIENAVTPGTSALAFIGSVVGVHKATQALSELHPKVISSSLSSEQEDRLHEAFASHSE